jgi:hypothetical protein
MRFDVSRVVLAAVEGALGDKKPTKKKSLSAGQALAVGAALAVLGRVAVGQGGRFVRDKVQDRLSDGSESEDAEDEDQELEAEVEQDEELEAELDEEELEAELDEEEPEAEQDEEPGAEVHEDDEPEGLRPSATRPRPPIFDRPDPRPSPVRPSRRPPRRKAASGQKPTLSAPRRPRRPRAPLGRT